MIALHGSPISWKPLHKSPLSRAKKVRSPLKRIGVQVNHLGLYGMGRIGESWGKEFTFQFRFDSRFRQFGSFRICTFLLQTEHRQEAIANFVGRLLFLSAATVPNFTVLWRSPQPAVPRVGAK